MKKITGYAIVLIMFSLAVVALMFSVNKLKEDLNVKDNVLSSKDASSLKSEKKYTEEQLKEFRHKYSDLFKKIASSTGVGWEEIQFFVQDNGNVNAYATIYGGKKTVVFFSGLIDFAASNFSQEDAEKVLSFVMAHELSHIVLGHVKQSGGSDPITEQEADLHAIKILVTIGIDCNGAYLFSKFVDHGETEFTTHPPSFFRAIYNKGFCDAYKKKFS